MSIISVRCLFSNITYKCLVSDESNKCDEKKESFTGAQMITLNLDFLHILRSTPSSSTFNNLK